MKLKVFSWVYEIQSIFLCILCNANSCNASSQILLPTSLITKISWWRLKCWFYNLWKWGFHVASVRHILNVPTWNETQFSETVKDDCFKNRERLTCFLVNNTRGRPYSAHAVFWPFLLPPWCMRTIWMPVLMDGPWVKSVK